MNTERLEEIKGLFEFERLNRGDQEELIEEVERLRAEIERLNLRFNQLMEFTLAAGLTPEWIEE